MLIWHKQSDTKHLTRLVSRSDQLVQLEQRDASHAVKHTYSDTYSDIVALARVRRQSSATFHRHFPPASASELSAGKKNGASSSTWSQSRVDLGRQTARLSKQSLTSFRNETSVRQAGQLRPRHRQPCFSSGGGQPTEASGRKEGGPSLRGERRNCVLTSLPMPQQWQPYTDTSTVLYYGVICVFFVERASHSCLICAVCRSCWPRVFNAALLFSRQK